MRRLLVDWLLAIAEMLEPRPPRRQEIDYTISKLPEEILAIIRISWYVDGRADEIDEMVLMEDGVNGYRAFEHVIVNALKRGANVSIRSSYNPQDLGIPV